MKASGSTRFPVLCVGAFYVGQIVVFREGAEPRRPWRVVAIGSGYIDVSPYLTPWRRLVGWLRRWAL